MVTKGRGQPSSALPLSQPPGPSSPTYRTKNAVTVLTFFFCKHVKIVFLEAAKMSFSDGDCLLFMEDLRLGSHLDVFFKG